MEGEGAIGGCKLEEWKPSDCTSRTNQHHDDVAPAESRAMIGRTHILSLFLPPHFYLSLSLSLSLSVIPFSSIRSAPRPYARNPMASGVGGDWTHLGDCGTHRPPLCTPFSLSLSLSLALSPSLTLSLSLLPFRPPRHPSYTAVNRVYPLAVAQPFNQTD